MKKLIRVIQWIVSIVLLYASFGGFLSGDYVLAGITLIIGLVVLPPIARRLFNKRSDQKTNEVLFQEKDISTNPTIQRGDYHPPIIQRQGVQILESLSLLSSTKNIDTLKGRFQFLIEIYPRHIEASNNQRFISDMQKSIDQYKLTFYERIPHEQEVSLLIKPNMENLRSYYTECIFNCFSLFLSEQAMEIEKLKKQDAKNKRIDKIRAVASSAQAELRKNGFNKERADIYHSEIDKVLYEYLTKVIAENSSISNKDEGNASSSADEINKNYQKADAKRTKDLDFILGVEVHRTRNIGNDDCEICEAGAGKYPKDYNWTIWHSGCMCYSTPILASEEEMDKATDALLDGKEYEFKGTITEFPKKMKDFMDRTGFKHAGHEDYFDKK